jgi:mannosyltransferase
MVAAVGAQRAEIMASERTEAASPTTVWPQRWQRTGAGARPALDLRMLMYSLRIPYPWSIVIALTFLAGLLRLVGIGEEAFWKNELFSVYWIKNPFEFLLTRGLITETNPPFYFVALKIWTALFGTGETAVRSLSAVASTASMPLAYLLGVELAGSTAAGLIAATLLALSPVQLFFAHEARVYAFLPLFVLVTLLGLCRFLRTPEKRAFQPDRGFASSLDIYSLGAIALLYSHATAVLVLAALFLTAILYMIEVHAPRSQISAFILANIIVGMLASPAIMALALQANSPNLEWIPPLTPATILAALRYLFIAPVVRFDITGGARDALSFAELGVAIATLLVLAVQARRLGRDRLGFALLVLFPVFFVTLLCGISIFRPILVPRITVWLTVPLALIAASAFTSPRSRKLHPIAVLLMASCIVLGLTDTTFARVRHNPDWRSFISDARAKLPNDTILVVGPHAGPLAITYYGDPALAERVRQWRTSPTHRETNAEWLERTVSGASTMTTLELRHAIQIGHPIALVLDTDDMESLRDLRQRIPELSTADRHDYAALFTFSWSPQAPTP